MTGPGPTSRTYFSQRLRLHYVDWGNPEHPPLLLLHGGRDHCRNWDWMAAALARRLARDRARPARPRRQPVVARTATTRWPATSTTWPSSSTSSGWRR